MSQANTNSIPLLNLQKLFQDHRAEFLERMTAVLDRCAFIGGDEVASFEKSFAKWIGADFHAAGCANGTDAITLATRALELPEGSEVIVPAMTYYATASALVNAGLKVKLVDVNDGTWLIDVKKIEGAISKNTRLIAPVHLYGQMAAMDEIRVIADKHHCAILEDAAQAHGSLWKGRPVGHWGDVASFSLYPGKNLGAFGDAGIILSKKLSIIESCWALGNHGGRKKYEHLAVGFNSRLDNLQAAALNVKLKYIDDWNDRRREIAKNYHEILGGVPGLEIPTELADAKHTYHLYAVLVEKRDDFMKFLKTHNVDSGIHYPLALHQQPAFANFEFAKESFPNAERVAGHEVSLPMCPTLTDEQVERVGTAVRAYFGGKR